MTKNTWLFRGLIGDEILPSFLRIYNITRNHSKDPYSTTRIQWNVSQGFFLRLISSLKRSRVDSIELTPPADTTCGILCQFVRVVFFCLRNAVFLFFWALAPYKKGTCILMIYYICCNIYIYLYVYHGSPTGHHVLDFRGWFTNCHLFKTVFFLSFKRNRHFKVVVDFQRVYIFFYYLQDTEYTQNRRDFFVFPEGMY